MSYQFRSYAWHQSHSTVTKKWTSVSHVWPLSDGALHVGLHNKLCVFITRGQTCLSKIIDTDTHSHQRQIVSAFDMGNEAMRLLHSLFLYRQESRMLTDSRPQYVNRQQTTICKQTTDQKKNTNQTRMFKQSRIQYLSASDQNIYWQKPE